MDIEECDVNGITALGHVYKEINYQQMQFLVAMGANIDRPMFENGRTMLMDVAMKGDSKLFAFILKQGADRDKRCHTGRTTVEYIKLPFEGKTMKSKTEMN